MNPDYSGGPAAITVILVRGMQAGGVRIREHSNVKTEAESRVICFDDERRGHKKLKKNQRNGFSLLSLQKEPAPPTH